MSNLAMRLSTNYHKSWNTFFDIPDVKMALNNFDRQYENSSNSYHPNNPLKIFELLPKDKVRIVVIGQDPYKERNIATDIAFNIDSNAPLTRSLIKMFEAAKISKDSIGDLSHWIKQGVFLINSTLTIRSGGGNEITNSHGLMTWNKFMEKFVSYISSEIDGVIFCLWGSNAQQLNSNNNIIHQRSFVFQSCHPVSSKDNFATKCDHFEMINSIVTPSINWKLPIRKRVEVKKDINNIDDDEGIEDDNDHHISSNIRNNINNDDIDYDDIKSDDDDDI